MPAAKPILTIHFQGLCAFVRNSRNFVDTTQVNVVLPAAERLEIEPKLCEHYPVLLFREGQFMLSSTPQFHRSAILPSLELVDGPNGERIHIEPRPSIGIWPLARRELRILGARNEKLTLQQSFSLTADLERMTNRGPVKPALLAANPPELVAARFLLSDGSLSVSSMAGMDADEQWVFVEEGSPLTNAIPFSFAQEIRYEFFAGSPGEAPVEIAARRLDDLSAPEEVLRLMRGSSITISNLCPVDGKEVKVERDFHAYYAMVNGGSFQPIPHLRARGSRVNLGACPPSSMFG